MTEIELQLRHAVDPIAIIARIDAAIATQQLRITMKGTLRSFPGCTHWHCKLGQQLGTLEITYWPEQGRAWIKVHRGRRAEWIDAVIPKLKQRIESLSR